MISLKARNVYSRLVETHGFHHHIPVTFAAQMEAGGLITPTSLHPSEVGDLV